MFKKITLTSALIFSSLFGLTTSSSSDEHHEKLHQIEALFKDAQIMAGPSVVDCKLSSGTQTKCFSISVKSEPKHYTPGPWCPRNKSDGAKSSGIWFLDGKVVDADGAFMSQLATTYKDSKWRMVDPDTGKIKVTETLEQCAAAARPDVSEEYENYCVECLPEYMAQDAISIYTIPLEPQTVWWGRSIKHSGAGVAFNGIRLDASAPVDAILGAYTIAPFDDCGGHVNLHVGYHYHAATDCLMKTAQPSSHAPVIGIAMDGYKIMTHKNTDGSIPDDLDRCFGHETEELGYHYHVGKAGTNENLGCFSAETGCFSTDQNQPCDASVRPPRP